jgi:hypothetical protein
MKKPSISRKGVCHWCSNEFFTTIKWQKYHITAKRNVYCSIKCSKNFSKKISRETLIETNKKYASARMKKNNPSFYPENLKKARQTKIKNKTLNLAPKIQGGNGKELPLTVKLLNKKLNWHTTYIVKTFLKSPYPSHYKLEIANPEKKIYIEIDGNSSYSRKEQSLRKEEFLIYSGWKLFRFKNKEIFNNLNECVEIIKKDL